MGKKYVEEGELKGYHKRLPAVKKPYSHFVTETKLQTTMDF